MKYSHCTQLSIAFIIYSAHARASECLQCTGLLQIRRVDQGRIELTVDPSANTDLMGKEQTMNADPVGMERTVVQRTREPGIAMESGHTTMSVGVTAITARPQQIPRVLVLQLSVFAVGVAGIWRLNVRH